MGSRVQAECVVTPNIICDPYTRDCSRCSIHRNPLICIVNPHIDCDPRSRNCDQCGWNPVEEYRRKEKLKALEKDKSLIRRSHKKPLIV